MATHDYAILSKYPSRTIKCDQQQVFEVVQRQAQMISILIPAYNCNVTYLVEILLNQAKRSTIPFEIIIADDGSTENFEQNRLLNSLEH